jgi:hypothetical protein
MRPERFDSAEQLLQRILPSFKQTSDYSDPWVYRGHYDAGWKLLPAALRDDGKRKLAPLRAVVEPRLHKFLPADNPLFQRQNPDRDECIRLTIQLATEVWAVRQFCDLADELGLLIPQQEKISDDLDGVISNVISFGQRSRLDTIHMNLFVDLPFAFAQHHGIPTRYLDWTRDPYAAAFFATEEPKDKDFREISPDMCIWSVNRAERTIKKMDWVHVPHGQHGYVHAQSGISLLVGERYWLDANPAIPEMTMQQFLLPRTEAQRLRELLFAIHRTSKAHLMPTLDNVAAVTMMKWGWPYRR